MSPNTARKSSSVAEKDVRFAIDAAIWAPVLLRLGVASVALETVRRPIDDVINEEYS